MDDSHLLEDLLEIKETAERCRRGLNPDGSFEPTAAGTMSWAPDNPMHSGVDQRLKSVLFRVAEAVELVRTEIGA